MSDLLLQQLMDVHGDMQGTRPSLNLKKNPIVGVSTYVTSKQELNHERIYPAWDAARQPSTNMGKVFARRTLLDTTKTLTYKRMFLLEKRAKFDDEWDDIETKEDALSSNFIKFNAFVKENLEKRERAKRKVFYEINLQNRRDKDIDRLKENYEFMLSIKSMMEERIKEYRLYENFLQSVVVHCPTFYKNINDVIFRYESLIHMKLYLAKSQQDGLTALENARSELAKLIETKTLKNVGLQNRLARMQERYDTAHQKSMMWEMVVDHVQQQCNHLKGTLHHIKTSCRSVYMQMCKRKRVAFAAAESDYQNQLAFINKTLGDLQKVINKTRATSTKSEKSA